MTEEKQITEETTQTPSQIPMVWKVGIAVIAVGAILVLGWQFFGNKPSDSEAPPQATQVESVSPANNSAITGDESPEELFQLGNSLYQSKRFDEAIEAYQQAIDRNPEYDAAYANLGAVYYAQQRLDLAEQAYQHAIDLSPKDADVVYNLGAIYLQQALSTGVPDQDKLAEAQNKINAAVELNPDLAQPYYGLGVVNQFLGNNNEAIASFEKFLDLDDGSDPLATKNATDILQQLKAGQ